MLVNHQEKRCTVLAEMNDLAQYTMEAGVRMSRIQESHWIPLSTMPAIKVKWKTTLTANDPDLLGITVCKLDQLKYLLRAKGYGMDSARS